ncbi:3'-phosphoadenosine 5'-phosphosulfate 3'-phosphatase [filamentous cyanobacterium CCP5]|nr:3'-phosphoadenosine 5'-phosphosulfate 3'-phosphatase [filamentous cyanobacterium CCP5]
MTPLSDRDDENIRKLLLECGQEALVLSAKAFEVFEKGVNDYVTSVDRRLDTRLSTAFEQWFSQDGVITEENQASKQLFKQNYDRLWLIDPIDGTDDFIGGKAHYSVMVGLLEQGRPRAGWVYAPAREQMVWGGAGWGLFHQVQGSPARLNPQPPPALEVACPIMIGDKDRRRYGEALCQVIQQQHPPLATTVQFLSLGSFGLKVIEVIKGQAGLYLYLNGRVKLWDTTGPIALAQAAGLTCCDLEGQPLQFEGEAIDIATLTHQQAIIVGWPDYVDRLLPAIQQAVNQVLP